MGEPDQTQLLELGGSSTGHSLLHTWGPCPLSAFLSLSLGAHCNSCRDRMKISWDGSRSHSRRLLLFPLHLADSGCLPFKGLLPIIHDGQGWMDGSSSAPRASLAPSLSMCSLYIPSQYIIKSEYKISILGPLWINV